MTAVHEMHYRQTNGFQASARGWEHTWADVGGCYGPSKIVKWIFHVRRSSHEIGIRLFFIENSESPAYRTPITGRVRFVLKDLRLQF